MMTELRKLVGARVREIRKSQKLTQFDLAEKVDLSLNMIGYIERGEKFPSAETFERLAEGLKVQVREFFGPPRLVYATTTERQLMLGQLADLIKDDLPELLVVLGEAVLERLKSRGKEGGIPVT